MKFQGQNHPKMFVADNLDANRYSEMVGITRSLFKNSHFVIFDLYGKDYMQQSYLDKLSFTF